MKIRKILKSLIVLIIAVGICFSAVIIRDGYHLYQQAIAEVSLEDKVTSIRSKEHFTTYEELPEIYVEAVISAEDKRFFSHPGFDILATGRALFNDIRAMSYVEGGSTVTQQLAKNMYFSQEKKLTRKVAEVFIAFDLEQSCSKKEIMELYLNTIYFGDGYYCVRDASQGYFGKDPEAMTDYESTLLAGIPNAPSKYSPTVSPELARKRQEQVVERMVACGYFSAEEAIETLAAGDGL